MQNWFSPLTFVLARSSEEGLRRHNEFLKAEIEMLRVRVPKQLIFLDNDKRERLLKLDEAIEPGISKLIMIVHPRTYQRWLERKSLGQKPTKKMGRTKTSLSTKKIIVRMLKEAGWGYGRIAGGLEAFPTPLQRFHSSHTCSTKLQVEESMRHSLSCWDRENRHRHCERSVARWLRA